YVSQNGVLVDGTVRTSGNGTAINFTPAAPFAPNAVIQVFVIATAQDTWFTVLAVTLIRTND
ncbi:MAG TPA: hypothetical protein VFT39_11695, partial [Vicinamibacterales bacterium]|nr:hypothetical protein [Vicinamibacterales bacterium]